MNLDLTEPNLYGVQLELTRDCNLRCTYCAVSQPTYEMTNMASGNVDRVVRDILAMGVRHVQLNGHGETTLISDWTRIAERFLQEGLEVSMLSNMARELTEREVDVFSRFAFVETSIDSADRIINRDVRRKSDIRTIYSNLLRIKARAIQTGSQEPLLGFSIVLYDRNIAGLDRLISMGLALGVSHFAMSGLFKYPDLPGVEPVQSIVTLRGAELREARRQLRNAQEVLTARGVKFRIGDGLPAVLAVMSDDGSVQAGDREIGTDSRVYLAPRPGETRDCLDPWSFSQLRADGDVSLYCFAPAVGKVDGATGVSEILNNDKSKHFRTGLLSGDIPDPCRTCWSKSTTTTEKLQAKVARHLAHEGKYPESSLHGMMEYLIRP